MSDVEESPWIWRIITFFDDICSIIEAGRRKAYAEISRVMIETYWNLGRRIVEEEQKGNKRAEYGAQIIDSHSDALTLKYGKGFSKRNLAYMRTFYQVLPDLKILQTRLQNLSWSHFTRVFASKTQLPYAGT